MSVVEALKGFRAELAETPAGLPRVRRAAKLSLLCAKELLGTAALAPFALTWQAALVAPFTLTWQALPSSGQVRCGHRVPQARAIFGSF